MKILGLRERERERERENTTTVEPPSTRTIQLTLLTNVSNYQIYGVWLTKLWATLGTLGCERKVTKMAKSD